MSTHAIIAKKQPDGQYKAVYLHFDGYPEWAGLILKLHYKEEEKIDALLNLGNISVIAPNRVPDPTKKHNFNIEKGSRQEDVCLFYGRDRGEPGEEAQMFHSLFYVKGAYGASYMYVWENGQWETTPLY